jgi:hypothetical protein
MPTGSYIHADGHYGPDTPAYVPVPGDRVYQAPPSSGGSSGGSSSGGSSSGGGSSTPPPDPFAGLTRVPNPAALAGLTESQIVRDPNSSAIYYAQGVTPPSSGGGGGTSTPAPAPTQTGGSSGGSSGSGLTPEQITGLNAASARIANGTANNTDRTNVAYAQNTYGYVSPTSAPASSSSQAPAQAPVAPVVPPTPPPVVPTPVVPTQPIQNPIAPAPVIAPGAGTVDQQGGVEPPAGSTYISDPEQLKSLTESQIWRQPGTGRIYKLSTSSNSGMPGSVSVGSGQLPPGSTTADGQIVGEYISDPADLANYTEDQIVRTPDGRIYTKQGVPLKKKGLATPPDQSQTGELPGETLDPFADLKAIAAKYNLDFPKPEDNPYDQFYTWYKKVYDDLGLTTIKTQLADINKQITDEANKRDEEVANINDDPWLTEGVRLRRNKRAAEKYDNKIKNLTNQFNMYESVYTRGSQEAQFVASKGMELNQNAVKLTQDLMFKAIDMAEKEAEAMAKSKEASYSSYKEVQGGLFDIKTNTWIVKPKPAAVSGPKAVKLTDNDRKSELSQFLTDNNLFGTDQKVSWETYVAMEQSWINNGGTAGGFDVNFPIGRYLDTDNQGEYKTAFGK